MIRMHANMGAAEEMGDRFVRAFGQAVEDAGLPADREFRAALMAYMRWATDQVLIYSPVAAVVPPELSMPRWSWTGPVPADTP
jgi:hemoglobin